MAVQVSFASGNIYLKLVEANDNDDVTELTKRISAEVKGIVQNQ